jgi:predicted RNA-binding protein
MSMVLTTIYLETAQKKALAAHAKRNGRKVSDVIREAVDAALLGVTTDELKLLDEASRKASEHINAMRDDLAGNSKDHKSFLRAMTKLQNAS